MKKIVRLTETDLVKLIKKVLKEDELAIQNVKIYNNPDYTITVVTRNGNRVKIKLSGSMAGAGFEINVAGLKSETDGGIILTGKSGRTTKVDSDAVKDLINFAESNQKELVISRKLGTVKIHCVKI